jgi:hypothetical protein
VSFHETGGYPPASRFAGRCHQRFPPGRCLPAG